MASASDYDDFSPVPGVSGTESETQSGTQQEGETSGNVATVRTAATSSTLRERQPGRDFWMTRIPPAFVITAFPVKGVSFCSCLENGVKCRYLQCKCGEDDSDLEWEWDEETAVAANIIEPELRTVHFQVKGSSGTAAVRGNKIMSHDQYFWEIKMITSVYGTDMMVGVGTEAVKLDKFRNQFCSMLGRDEESWGLSYQGRIQHAGEMQQYSSVFGQGTLIGVHLDMWHGRLAFYKNRRPLGIAFRGLNGKQLYPMLSSTAALTGMKLIKARSFLTSLQFLCCQALRRIIPPHLDVFDVLPLPPGLKDFLDNNFSWLLQRSNGDGMEGDQVDVGCNLDTDDEDIPSDDSTFHPSSPSSFPSPSPSSCSSPMGAPSGGEFSSYDGVLSSLQTVRDDSASLDLDDTLRMSDASATDFSHGRDRPQRLERCEVGLSPSWMPASSCSDLDETLQMLDEAARNRDVPDSRQIPSTNLTVPDTLESDLRQNTPLTKQQQNSVYEDAPLSVVSGSEMCSLNACVSQSAPEEETVITDISHTGHSDTGNVMTSIETVASCSSNEAGGGDGVRTSCREIKRKAGEEMDIDEIDASRQKRWRTYEEDSD